jgi:hypothetical protein
MVVNRMIECFARDLVPECCKGLESSAANNAPQIFVESLQGDSNRSLPSLPFHMHAEENSPTV